MPATNRSCRGTGCVWQEFQWGSCSVVCGNGTQHRNVTCSGATDAECNRDRPVTTRSCQGDGVCQWAASDWSSQCSSSCGAGVLTRTISCAGAGPGGVCSGSPPAREQACYNTSGCAWHVADWGHCNKGCGWGIRTRVVSCPSGQSGDCQQDRPVDAEICHNVSGCVWSTSDWDECSETCGRGTQMRTVSCPSGRDSDCSGQRPLLYADCHATSGCAWRTSDWSTCSSWCGDGVESRQVTCASGHDADCGSAGPKPTSTRSCSTTAGCGWSLSEWSDCDATCGPGLQKRTAVCTSADSAECAKNSLPRLEQACYNTNGCDWIKGAWGSCSTDCGPGVQSRNVTCSGGIDSADCSSLEKPAERRPCNGTKSCTWMTAPWTLCSAKSACGNGTQTRALFCTAGSGAECPEDMRPPDVQECFESAGCRWQVAGEWGSCSATCGNGTQERQLTCPAGKHGSCTGRKPLHSRVCQAPKGQCKFVVGDWSTCSATCGEGVQKREVKCPSSSAEDCLQSVPPPTEQTCYSTAECVWKAAEWGQCSNLCGTGTRKRDVACSSGRSPSGLVSVKILVICSRALSNAPVATLPTA